MPSKRTDDSVKIANALRNYANVSRAEIKRLRGDLTAYRQEAQTNFKQNVAFPRATVNVGDDPADIPIPTTANAPDAEDTNSVVSSAPSTASVSGMSTIATDSPSSQSDFNNELSEMSDNQRAFNAGVQRAQTLIEQMNNAMSGSQSDTSIGAETLMDLAGQGAGRLTEPEGITTDTDASKRVSFNPKLDEFMDLTDIEETRGIEIEPRASRTQRKQRRANKTMKDIRAELKRAGVRNYSHLNQVELHAFAIQNGIEIKR